MYDDIKTQVSARLSAELRSRFGHTNVEIVDTADRAEFFGNLMISALSSPTMLERVEEGTTICWAAIVNGQPYGLGMSRRAYDWLPEGQAFGFANVTSTTADDIDHIWRTIVAELL